MDKKYKLILLVILSGLGFAYSWLPVGFPFIIFVAFIPVLFIEEQFFINKRKSGLLLLYVYPVFFIFNLMTTWWISNATVAGAIFAIVLNALFMTLIVFFSHLIRKKTNSLISFISLICFWLAFEYLHLRWDLSWPWLSLGNVFASYPSIVQWYEFTGILGGSLWILIINILLFNAFKYLRNKNFANSFIIVSLFLLVIPILFSFIIYRGYKEKGKKINVTVVQPNIDPYNEKFGGMELKLQIDKMLFLAKEQIDISTELVVFPETAISESVWENNLSGEEAVLRIKKFVAEYQDLSVLIGVSSFKMYNNKKDITPTARKYYGDSLFYDAFNSALYIEADGAMQIYHKSKLVPGVEKMPYPAFFKPLEKFSIDLGGMTGSLGTQDNRTPFYDKKRNIRIAPAICYESIYGEFLGEYIKNGAKLICIITNDGWWGNTAGYKQHFEYARLRAIETRRFIVRSANTGISGIINQRGDVIKSSNWWTATAFNDEVILNDKVTFYARFGDYIGKYSLYFSFIILLYVIIKRVACSL